jgi:hypothetical protein
MVFRNPRIPEKQISPFYSGIDMKANGGFVVAPPSKVEYGEHIWLNNPNIVPPSAIPEWLFFDMSKQTYQDALSVFSTDILNGADSGNHNQAAAIYAGHLFARYPVDEWDSHCWVQFKLWNNQNCPPLSESELRKTFKSIRRNELPKKQARCNSFPSSGGLGPTVAERNVPIYEWSEFVNTPTEENGTWLVKT